MAGIQLPAFPSTQTLSSTVPTIQSTLQRYVSSTAQHDSETYIATYAKRRAHATLQNTVWGTTSSSSIPEEIPRLTLLIAQRTTHPIPIHTLIDLSVVYAHSPYLPHLQLLFQTQYSLYPVQLTDSMRNDVLPAFTSLLASEDQLHQALASKRKISEAIVCLLRASSPIHTLVRLFSLSKDFITSLASLYDAGLTSIAKSHGGYRALQTLTTHVGDDDDDWPHIWIQTKIALIDAFHIVLTSLSDDPEQNEAEKERIFDTLFALLDLGSATPSSATPSTPFLDLPLIADYHHAYNLLERLSSIFNEPGSERDPRLDLLEASLSSHLAGIDKKNPGVLKIALRSKMTPTTTTTNEVQLASAPTPVAKGERSTVSSLEPGTAQILAILPHLSPSRVTRLLRNDRFGGNVERVLEGLLDGSLESEDVDEKEEEEEEGRKERKSGKGKQRADEEEGGTSGRVDFVAERRNVFDDEELDVARVRVGKQDVGSDLRQDRSTIEKMKWDILRRVEAMEEAEAELLEEQEQEQGGIFSKEKANLRSETDIYDEDEIALVGASRIRPLVGDEESEADTTTSSSDGECARTETLDPETIIEQAYLRDPTVFYRDGSTRRGRARIELRNLTGWADEQIEGWKVILERTPGKKAKLEEKHAFSGNVKGMEVPGTGPSRGRGRGRGHGGEGSRGFKRGGGRGGRGGGGGSNRKRGHDKKIAKAGGIGS